MDVVDAVNFIKMKRSIRSGALNYSEEKSILSSMKRIQEENPELECLKNDITFVEDCIELEESKLI